MGWAGPFDPSSDPLWVQFQCDAITEREYWAARSAEHGLDTKAFMRHFYDPPGPHLLRPEMMELVSRSKAAGRKVGILTNDLEAFHGREWMDAFALFDDVEVLVDGSVTGILKPDPGAYSKALAGLGAEPGEVVFVDDQPINVHGAQELGMTTVWFDVADPIGSTRIAAELLGLG
jgi:putative hydrolase of the HAD superfamily